MTTLIRITLLALLLSVAASAPAEPVAQETGTPILDLQVDPPTITLDRADLRFSILVSGRTAAGRLVDVTDEAEYEIEPAGVARVSARGVVFPLSDGSAIVQVRAAGHNATVRVTVEGAARPRQFNFERDLVPLLSRFGCNASSCHG